MINADLLDGGYVSNTGRQIDWAAVWQAGQSGFASRMDVDQWCFFFAQVTGVPCPAPEDFGFGDAARRRQVIDFPTFFSALAPFADPGAKLPAAPAPSGGGGINGGTGGNGTGGTGGNTTDKKKVLLIVAVVVAAYWLWS